jgi:Xaa-Pro aminopeptidase
LKERHIDGNEGVNVIKWRLSEGEFKRRIEELKRELVKRGLNAAYLTDGLSFYYFTGFSYIPTERPAALIIPLEGEITYMGPIIEQEHIPSKTNLITSIKVYRDYPGPTHPMELFARWIKEMGLGDKAFGIENPKGCAGIWGYRGPPISEKLPNAKFEPIKEFIEDMWMFSSDEEIALRREAAKWGNLGMTLLQEYTEPGLYDWEIQLKASLDASRIMKKALGPDYYPIGPGWGGVLCSPGFRGQVGPGSAFPHAMFYPRPIQEGDVLGTGSGANVSGYGAELERCFIVGEPSEKQRRLFNIMVEGQDAALAKFRPGINLAEVDKAVMAVFKKHGVLEYERHHTGHGMALTGHHKPWVDQGEDFVIQPRMLFSCEPGLYVPGYGGFRHSDTVFITEDGSEMITYYPRDIESLTIC